MTPISGSLKSELAEISALIDNNRLQDGELHLVSLINKTGFNELLLVSPDIEAIIQRFFPKRRKQLQEIHQNALSKRKSLTATTIVIKRFQEKVNPPEVKTPVTGIDAYLDILAELRDRHIYQWSTHYRDRISFIFKDISLNLNKPDARHNDLDGLMTALANHAEEIFSRGYRYLTKTGLSLDTIRIKSSSGLLQFLFLIAEIYLANRDTIKSAREARSAWAIVSSLLVGVLKGYGRAEFGQIRGWDILLDINRSWVPVLGFTRGSDAITFFQEFPSSDWVNEAFSTLVPTLLAFEQLSNRHHGENFLLPRLSRVPIGQPARLEITLNKYVNRSMRDIIVSTFYESPIGQERLIADALGLRSTLIVAKLAPAVSDWAVQQNITARVIDVSDVSQKPDHAQSFAEIVRAALEANCNAEAEQSTRNSLIRNYAHEFPLEDPEFRRLFLVERHSVKRLLEQFHSQTGIHLWCSVRRSGKTTAVSNESYANGQTAVVVQTMDHQPNQLELNVLEKNIREALMAKDPIGPNFFSEVVQECLISCLPIERKSSKIVLVIDEYESLFGLIDALTRRDPDLRYLVAQPLLSQMVSFAANNLLILMGQRPDAHYILASQNQLSPLVRQHNFPLFEHFQGATDTEFTQFLRLVLTEKVPFLPSFSDAVYDETAGHPYLTVNLMVDLCDWLIENKVEEGTGPLEGARFSSFAKDRLSMPVLQRSPYYPFFQSTLSSYMSERCRESEPWLYAIASVLHGIGTKHHKVFSCSIPGYQAIATKFASATRMTSEQLLATGGMSNFLRLKDGQVSPAIRLMGRLAASVVPEVN